MAALSRGDAGRGRGTAATASGEGTSRDGGLRTRGTATGRPDDVAASGQRSSRKRGHKGQCQRRPRPRGDGRPRVGGTDGAARTRPTSQPAVGGAPQAPDATTDIASEGWRRRGLRGGGADGVAWQRRRRRAAAPRPGSAVALSTAVQRWPRASSCAGRLRSRASSSANRCRHRLLSAAGSQHCPTSSRASHRWSGAYSSAGCCSRRASSRTSRRRSRASRVGRSLRRALSCAPRRWRRASFRPPCCHHVAAAIGRDSRATSGVGRDGAGRSAAGAARLDDGRTRW